MGSSGSDAFLIAVQSVQVRRNPLIESRFQVIDTLFCTTIKFVIYVDNDFLHAFTLAL